jgi:hypothetical protein
MEPDPRRALTALKRFVRREEPAAHCDLCAASLRDEHDHLVEPETRSLVCACRPCALLFPEGPGARYRRIRSRAVRVPGLHFDDAALAALGVPVRLAILCPSQVHDAVFALFPNAAGATEATIPMVEWSAAVVAHPVLAPVTIVPDAEALIIDQMSGRSRCFVASLDVCHHFIGLLRARSGAQESSLARAMRFLDGLPGGGHG